MRGLVLLPTPGTEDMLVDYCERNHDLISKFRITTTAKCLARIKHFLGKNAIAAIPVENNVLGGDAQVATQVVLHDVGAVFLFRDPLAVSSSQPDCDALLRLLNVHNILTATNPATAECLTYLLEEAMEEKSLVVKKILIPSFFLSLESPAVAKYQEKQKAVIAAGIARAEAKKGEAAAKPPEKPQEVKLVTSDRAQFAQQLFATQTPDKETAERLASKSKSSAAAERSAALSKRRSADQATFEASLEKSVGKRTPLGDSGASGAFVTGIKNASAAHMMSVNTKALCFAARMKNAATVAAHKRNVPMAKKRVAFEEEGRPADEIEDDGDGAGHRMRAQQMRCLALVSHNNMKDAMQDFVIKHKEVLKRFRLTGTNSTMTMLKSVLGEGDDVVYGPTCSSGPLGGDAELGAQMCVHGLGGVVFFTDPLEPHPHAFDISALIRMCDLHNVLHASNPTTADALAHVLKRGLDEPELIPSFYMTAMSPAIAYHELQDAEKERALAAPLLPPRVLLSTVVAAAATGATFGALLALKLRRA